MKTPKRILALLVLVGVVTVLVCGCPPTNRQFTNAYRGGGYNGGLYDGVAPGEVRETDDAMDDATKTRDVVEPDVIRRDGSILYVLNQYRGLMVVDLTTKTLLAQLPTYGRPRDLYLDNGRAYVLVANAAQYEQDGNTLQYEVMSRLFVADVSTPASAQLVGAPFDFPGDLVDSRLVGDVLYAVCAEHAYYYYGGVAVDADTATVSGEGGEGGGAVGGGSVAKSETADASWVTSINLADPANIYKADELSFAGIGDVIHATNTALFVAGSNWNWENNTDTTTITYVDISDPTGAISVNEKTMLVKGMVQDKFKMDVMDNVLRVVSGERSWWDTRDVFVTTFDLADPEFKPLGELLIAGATGETLFATRFDGPRAYVVTYLVKDPLWVVDLADPAKPQVLGELIVDGYSTYIEVQGNRLIALGVDNANSINYMSCSMYDVSDPANPVVVGSPVSFGDDWAWSPALEDVKAFTVLDDLLIAPVCGWNAEGQYNRLQFISYSDAGLVKQGSVDLTGSIMRSFEYEGSYYGVTSEEVATIDATDLANPQVADRLVLAENVAAVLELDATHGALVISKNDKTVVRTITRDGVALDEVTVDVGYFERAFVMEDSVVLVGVGQDPSTWEQYYQVARIDCAVPDALVVLMDKTTDIKPFWDWYGWYGGPEYLLDKDMMLGRWWNYYQPTDRSFLAGDRLVLRCQSDTFESTFGADTAYQGLAVLDFETQEFDVVGLGYNNLVSVDAAGTKLYLTTRQTTDGVLEWLGSVCSYYVQQFDPAAFTMGPAVNVPGLFVDYLPGEDILLVRDDQWSWRGDMVSSLRSVKWNGGPSVTPVDELGLPANVQRMLARDGRVYISAYGDAGSHLYAAKVDDDGDLHMSAGLLITEQWSNLVEAYGDFACVNIGDGWSGQTAMALYDFSDGGELAEVFQYMSWPTAIHAGDDWVGIALSYSGYDILER